MLDPKREKIANKIKELLKKTTSNGCSEAEALTAAEIVGRLMAEYDLSMTEIEFKNVDFITLEILTESRVAGPIHNIMNAIADYTDTKSWFSRQDVIKYSFFGSAQDTEIANYLFVILSRAIKQETTAYKNTPAYKNSMINGRTKTSSFATGMAARLSSRLMDMKREQMIANEAVSTSLVTVDKKSIVSSEFDKLRMNLKSSSRRISAKASGAYHDGQSAGDRVSIKSALNKGQSRSTLSLS